MIENPGGKQSIVTTQHITLDQSEALVMIRTVQDADLDEIRNLIAAAVQENVASSQEDAAFLMDDIDTSLTWWLGNKELALHLNWVQDDSIVGVILIKKYWNLTNLFVHPSHQGQGIGRALVLAGLEACRNRSPKGKLQVNSSANAVSFYTRLGFEQTGPGIDRPGGCVPLEYVL